MAQPQTSAEKTTEKATLIFQRSHCHNNIKK